MGKKSLIKSTAKKKSSETEGKEKSTKKTTAKSTKKTSAKAAKKSTSKTTNKSAAKTTKKPVPKKKTAQKTTSSKSKAASKKPKATKKVSLKDLVFKNFGYSQAPPAPIAVSKPVVSNTSAPPLIGSSDPKEIERQRSLLFNNFSMNEIKAAAKVPEPKTDTSPKCNAAETFPEDPAFTSQLDTNAARIIVEPDAQMQVNEPMPRPFKIVLAVAATIIFSMLAISYNNSSKYYIHPKEDAIEIWKGRFSPKDNQFFMVLEDTQVAGPVKDIYNSKEVFPIIFNYYINKADALLEVPDLPDLESIKKHLYEAKDFTTSDAMETTVTSRINTIDRMILLYKADVAISKNTEDSLERAISILKKAKKLTPSPAQSEEITQKINTARESAAKLQAGEKQDAKTEKESK